ncbi:uncharacterized protein LOC119186246 isoform X1 [Rhipicephalus microplus]|uniref:uncharacterized protein LOC119186246 isoform X1 n=2 Tax=Rhipicephalus microplus TaxID=6941 RepID=UPI003F6CD58A
MADIPRSSNEENARRERQRKSARERARRRRANPDVRAREAEAKRIRRKLDPGLRAREAEAQRQWREAHPEQRCKDAAVKRLRRKADHGLRVIEDFQRRQRYSSSEISTRERTARKSTLQQHTEKVRDHEEENSPAAWGTQDGARRSIRLQCKKRLDYDEQTYTAAVGTPDSLVKESNTAAVGSQDSAQKSTHQQCKETQDHKEEGSLVAIGTEDSAWNSTQLQLEEKLQERAAENSRVAMRTQDSAPSEQLHNLIAKSRITRRLVISFCSKHRQKVSIGIGTTPYCLVSSSTQATWVRKDQSTSCLYTKRSIGTQAFSEYYQRSPNEDPPVTEKNVNATPMSCLSSYSTCSQDNKLVMPGISPPMMVKGRKMLPKGGPTDTKKNVAARQRGASCFNTRTATASVCVMPGISPQKAVREGLKKEGLAITESSIAVKASADPSYNKTSPVSICIMPSVGTHTKVQECKLLPRKGLSISKKNTAVVPSRSLGCSTSSFPASIRVMPAISTQTRVTERKLLPEGGSIVTQQNVAVASPCFNASASASGIYIMSGIGAQPRVPEYLLMPIMNPSMTVENVRLPKSHLPFSSSISPANTCIIPSASTLGEVSEHKLTTTQGPSITNAYFAGRQGTCMSFNTSTAAKNICSMPGIGTQAQLAECKEVPMMGPFTIMNHATAPAHTYMSRDHGSGTHKDNETSRSSIGGGLIS